MDAEKVSRGFALPTVLIASVLMLTVIVAAAGAVSNTRVGLDSEYYLSLAGDAAEAGSTYATTCIRSNSGASLWGTGGSTGATLAPNTDCSGNPQSSQSAYIASTPAYRTSFSVGAATNSGAGSYLATSTGRLELLRPNGMVWKTVTRTVNVQTGGQINVNNVAFGYSAGSAGNGAFFGAIGGDGKMRTVGWNAYGQLGNGTTSSTLAPTIFNVPGTVTSAYTNFLSGGTNLFAVLSDGSAYGAGWNNQWQLGINSNTTPISTPTKVVFPSGVTKWLSITTGGDRTFLLGNDNKLYGTGNCDLGQIGTGYTISGCYNVHVPTRVLLPGVTADPNTIPTSQVVTDRNSVYVVMQGGALYGWGTNNLEQLGDSPWNNNFADTSTPKKIGTYGDSGQPRVVQVVTDGDTAYILDSNGQVNSIGLGTYGEMGQGDAGVAMYMYINGNKVCFDQNGTGSGPAVWLYACNGTNPQRWSIKLAGNTLQSVSNNKCVDTGGGTGNNTPLTLATCTGGPSQIFVWEPHVGQWNGQFRNPQSNRCIDNLNGDGKNLQLYDCLNNWNQKIHIYSATPVPIDTSQFGGTVTKITADLWSMSCLTTNGEVWSAGLSQTGHFGYGGTTNFGSKPVRFNLPPGVTAVDIYQTSASPSQENLFVVGSDGKVYGAGSNSHGELGNGTNTAQTTPVAMSVIDGQMIAAQAVQSGYSTTIIFTKGGAVFTTGNNSNGQLGDGTTNDSWVPIKAKYTNNLGTSVY